MKLESANSSISHLGYCTNIHAGESWEEVRAALERYLPAVRAAVVPDDEMGVGLRLSARAVSELGDAATLEAFRDFLGHERLYVFTINGFPYGPFHGTTVKQNVYLPDWMDPARGRYTSELADVLAMLLPESLQGTISTVPGAFKSSVRGREDIRRMADQLIDQVAHLAALEQRTGRTVSLTLEPEPCCFLETIEESIAFFEEYLFSNAASSRLAKRLGITTSAAETCLRRHLGLCLDLCHAAVEYEAFPTCLDQLSAAGIAIGKLQISSGLRVPQVTREIAERLRDFDDGVYLHQVVERVEGKLNRYTDLPDAIAALPDDDHAREWRVHFHVPIFHDPPGELRSTQDFVGTALDHHRQHPISDHLEVETYTWDVLPERLRTMPIEQAISRELQWVIERLV